MVFTLFRRAATRFHTPGSRFYGTPPGAQHSIYISKSTNPYFNLTFEDWLFRHKNPEEPLLLIYRDDPCVIIGRNQNPWKEVNFEALRARPHIPFVRRRSGGGTVYHDMGNTNFSIHLPRHSFDRHITAQIVLRAVRSFGIDARVNDRNDICVGEEKISSAYKIVNKRAYHHGTMLISSRLDTLGDLLRTNKDTMITKGVASVRSPVCNLQQFSPTIVHELFVDAVVSEFQKEYSINAPVVHIEETDQMKNIEYIRRGLDELPSWNWAYGQTPEFTYTIENPFSWGDVTAEIRSKHGLVIACNFQLINTLNNTIPESLSVLGRSLEGKRYGSFEESFVREADIGPMQEVAIWIQRMTQTRP
ncbi:Lipoyltransferase and lipoate-protein ligase [Collybia nuda]|uniref:Putative lipoate-protein ligase A n=1 Tax=Collybia nuda TaxID=64659 RepID=A0A9P5Y248_9AGAR|nr:Lipoyltransferase and lipoate-protein ligase [Collybia nuda]